MVALFRPSYRDIPCLLALETRICLHIGFEGDESASVNFKQFLLILRTLVRISLNK